MADNYLISVAEDGFTEADGWTWNAQALLAVDSSCIACLAQELIAKLQQPCLCEDSLDKFVWKEASTGCVYR